MATFYAPHEQISNGRVVLSGDEAHHAVHVLRRQVGGTITVVDGQGMEFDVRVTRCSSFGVEGEIVAQRRRPHDPMVHVTLAQAMPKGQRMDMVVEKATEIGAGEIIPMMTERTVVNPDPSASHRRTRWQTIATNAMKQSGRAVLPQVAAPTEFASVLELIPEHTLALIATPRERVRTPKKALSRLHPGKHRVLVLVGPEGDFSDEEVARATEAGARPVTLGPRVLRAETAGILLVALVLYELGELS